MPRAISGSAKNRKLNFMVNLNSERTMKAVTAVMDQLGNTFDLCQTHAMRAQDQGWTILEDEADLAPQCECDACRIPGRIFPK
jgi:hypothetical protein